MAKVMVDIPGVGTVEATNAASESTLQELVKVMGGNANGSSTGGAGGGFGGGKLSTKEIKNFSDEIKDTTNVVEDLAGAMTSLTGKLVKGVIGAASGVAGSIATFGSAVTFGTGKMEEIFGALPLVGSVLGPLGNALDDTVDSFRDAASVGASFGNDMLGVTKVAAQAGLTVSQFQSVISNSSESLALLGGNVTQGALRFAEVSKGLRTGRLGDRLMNMGFSMEMINEGFISYSEEMARQGRLSGMSNRELMEGSANYMEELDELAKTTGKTREELAQMRMQALDDAKINRMANGLEGEQRDNFLNNITQLNAVSPGLRDIFVDLADGVAQTEEAQMLLASSAGQSAMALAQQMATGELSEAEFNNRLKALGPELDGFFGNMSQAQLAALETSNPALYTLAESAIALNRLQEKSATLTQAEQDERNKLTDFTTSFQQAFVEFQGKIRSLFLDSPLFETLSSAFTDLLSPVEGTKDIFDKMKPGLDDMLGSLNDFLTSFMSNPAQAMADLKENLKEDFKTAFGGILEDIKTGIYTSFGVENFEELKTKLLTMANDGLLSLFGVENWSELKDKLMEYAGGVVSGFWDSIKGWIGDNLGAILATAAVGIGAALFLPVTATFAAIAAGVALFLSWEDTIKPKIQSMYDTVMGFFGGIGDFFSGLFDFNIELPNFSDYLPKWMGGAGKSLGDLFGSDTPTEAAEVAASTPDEPAATTQTATAASPAQSMEQNEAVALNTTMQRMISLLEENNRLTRRTVNAIAEGGNLQG